MGFSGSDDSGRDQTLLPRKSVLMGMAASMGLVFANPAKLSPVAAGSVKPLPIAATQPAYAPIWTPNTAYALGQQVISANNDVVSAKSAHRSSAAYSTDTVKWALSSTFGRKDVRQVDFATYPGVDCTGASSCDAAFAALIASIDTPTVIHMGPGTYSFNLPWGVINPELVNIQGQGPYHTVILATTVTTGPFLQVQKSTASNYKQRVLADLRIEGPCDPATTVDCIVWGGATTYANQCVNECVTINGFRDQEVLGSNTWLLAHIACNYRNAARYTWNGDVTVTTNAGEGIRWYDGVMFGALGTCVKANGRYSVDFIGTSFDYNHKVAIVSNGSAFNTTNCHFETGNAATGDATIELQTGGIYNPRISLKAPTIVPAYTSAGACRTFVRITGVAGSTNSHPVVDFDGPSVLNTSGNAGVNALLIDSSVSSVSVSASPEAHVLVRGVSYQDAGGPQGNYFPFYVQDRVGRRHLIEPGVDYGDLSIATAAGGGWSHPVAHVSETMPRLAATDKFQMVSGDLYVVRLPLLGADSWRAAAFEMGIAIAAAGRTPTNANLALYDGGSDSSGPVTTLTRVANISSLGLTSAPNTIKSGAVASALAVGQQRTRLFVGLCFVMATMPEVYGVKHATASPLLDPIAGVFPIVAGKLARQTGCPGSLAVSTLAKADFVPCAYIRPTSYA